MVSKNLHKAKTVKNDENYVKVDPQFYRPAEINVLCSDASKIKEDLGWEPTMKFKDIIERVVNNDLNLCKGCNGR